MRTLKVKVPTGVDFHSVESAALAAIQRDRQNTLVLSWYDSSHGVGGPTELCHGEPPVAARDYGRSHGAEWDVVSEDLELYLASVPADTAQLDPDMLIEVHRGLERDTFANLQGG